MSSPALLEASVPADELERAVSRLLSHCKPARGGCLLHPEVNNATPQLRVRLARGRYTTLSGPRAVLLSAGRPPGPDEVVIRTCDERRCLAVKHLASRPPGPDSLPAKARERMAYAHRQASADRIIWGPRSVARLQSLIDRGATVAEAADRLGIPKGTAYSLLLRERGVSRKNSGAERCSRCGEHGHRRSNLSCPARRR